MKTLYAPSLAGLLFLGGCALLARIGSEPSPQPAAAGSRDESLTIAARDLPPPGECRVWVPGTTPGEQSAPGPCGSLQKKIPPGGWLLYRSEEKAAEVAVSVYRSKWPRRVSETRYFDYWTGRLLRVDSGG
jgi:hypothetical protein